MIQSIIKRDGRVVLYDMNKIAAAILKAIESQHDEDRYSEDELRNYHQYIRIMAEFDWPAYLNPDIFFHQIVIDQFESDGEAGVVSALYDYYDALYLKDLENELSESEVINKDRLPLFKEAFLLYQLGYYYGAVSILITQIVGITADIEKYLKRNNASYDPKTLELIEKRYGFNHVNDTSRVMTAVLESKQIDENEGEYGFLMGYLRFKIFDTHISKEEMEKHVNRHQLCHGAQLNYGTKKHALKVILCIDALTTVAAVIADRLKE